MRARRGFAQQNSGVPSRPLLFVTRRFRDPQRIARSGGVGMPAKSGGVRGDASQSQKYMESVAFHAASLALAMQASLRCQSLRHGGGADSVGALRRGGARERRKGEYPLAFCATIVAKRSPPSLSLSRPPAPVAPRIPVRVTFADID